MHRTLILLHPAIARAVTLPRCARQLEVSTIRKNGAQFFKVQHVHALPAVDAYMIPGGNAHWPTDLSMTRGPRVAR